MSLEAGGNPGLARLEISSIFVDKARKDIALMALASGNTNIFEQPEHEPPATTPPKDRVAKKARYE
jgi:hypothetical protein